MITSVIPRRRGIRGLNDAFNPATPYAATQNFLDMQADPSVQSRVMDIVSSGTVGNYSNYRVYNEASTDRVWVDIGISYPKLQEITPATMTSAPPPATQSDCPCNNCHEETVIETWYASKEQSSDSDIPVNMTSEVVVCEPTENNAPQPLCANDLAALSAQGINGLVNVYPIQSKVNMAYTAKQKKCIDGCKGLPEGDPWNKCMTRCNSTNYQPSLSGVGAVSKGNYQQGLVFTGRTADSDWGKCATACNGKGLSQNELQKCYDACKTGRAAVNSGYVVSENGQLIRTLSGLSNDSVETDPVVYENPPIYYTQPTMDCQKGSDNTMAFALVAIGGAVLGGLLVRAITKTR